MGRSKTSFHEAKIQSIKIFYKEYFAEYYNLLFNKNDITYTNKNENKINIAEKSINIENIDYLNSKIIYSKCIDLNSSYSSSSIKTLSDLHKENYSDNFLRANNDIIQINNNTTNLDKFCSDVYCNDKNIDKDKELSKKINYHTDDSQVNLNNIYNNFFIDIKSNDANDSNINVDNLENKEIEYNKNNKELIINYCNNGNDSITHKKYKNKIKIKEINSLKNLSKDTDSSSLIIKLNSKEQDKKIILKKTFESDEDDKSKNPITKKNSNKKNKIDNKEKFSNLKNKINCFKVSNNNSNNICDLDTEINIVNHENYLFQNLSPCENKRNIRKNQRDIYLINDFINKKIEDNFIDDNKNKNVRLNSHHEILPSSFQLVLVENKNKELLENNLINNNNNTNKYNKIPIKNIISNEKIKNPDLKNDYIKNTSCKYINSNNDILNNSNHLEELNENPNSQYSIFSFKLSNLDQKKPNKNINNISNIYSITEENKMSCSESSLSNISKNSFEYKRSSETNKGKKMSNIIDLTSDSDDSSRFFFEKKNLINYEKSKNKEKGDLFINKNTINKKNDNDDTYVSKNSNGKKNEDFCNNNITFVKNEYSTFSNLSNQGGIKNNLENMCKKRLTNNILINNVKNDENPNILKDYSDKNIFSNKLLESDNHTKEDEILFISETSTTKSDNEISNINFNRKEGIDLISKKVLNKKNHIFKIVEKDKQNLKFFNQINEKEIIKSDNDNSMDLSSDYISNKSLLITSDIEFSKKSSNLKNFKNKNLSENKLCKSNDLKKDKKIKYKKFKIKENSLESKKELILKDKNKAEKNTGDFMEKKVSNSNIDPKGQNINSKLNKHNSNSLLANKRNREVDFNLNEKDKNYILNKFVLNKEKKFFGKISATEENLTNKVKHFENINIPIQFNKSILPDNSHKKLKYINKKNSSNSFDFEKKKQIDNQKENIISKRKIDKTNEKKSNSNFIQRSFEELTSSGINKPITEISIDSSKIENMKKYKFNNENIIKLENLSKDENSYVEINLSLNNSSNELNIEDDIVINTNKNININCKLDIENKNVINHSKEKLSNKQNKIKENTLKFNFDFCKFFKESLLVNIPKNDIQIINYKYRLKIEEKLNPSELLNIYFHKKPKERNKYKIEIGNVKNLANSKNEYTGYFINKKNGIRQEIDIMDSYYKARQRLNQLILCDLFAEEKTYGEIIDKIMLA